MCLLWVKTSIRAFTSSNGYRMDMKLICICSIFNGKHRLKGIYCEYDLLSDHAPLVQDMECIWNWSIIVIDLNWMVNID